MYDLTLTVFVAGIVGVFTAFSFFAILQQDVYKKEYDFNGAKTKFTQTLFMMACERSINSIVAFVAMTVFGGSGLKVPLQEMTVSGVTQMISMSSSNEALRYVSFTTQVLFNHISFLSFH
jgi:UDP-galactose transporter B1